MPYKGLIDCATKTAAREGITGFWAGLPTYVVRIAPHVMIVKYLSEITCLDSGGLRIFEEDVQMSVIAISFSCNVKSTSLLCY